MRHAFLITAYNNFENLNRLLTVLDDPRSEIFLHIDSKVPQPHDALVRPMQAAKIHFIPSMNVKWGNISQIVCTLELIRYALDFEWDYCHYVTESDMPLKTMDGLDHIFEKYAGWELVDFFPGAYEDARYKCEAYHWFVGFSGYRTNKLLKAANHLCAKTQLKLGLRRKQGKCYHGSAYFSISRDFACYCLQWQDEVYKKYRFTLATDEVWLQTLCAESPYLNRVRFLETEDFMGNLRLIDWKRRSGSSPYTYQEADWEELKNAVDQTELCFARKFTKDSVVAQRLLDYLKEGIDYGQ